MSRVQKGMSDFREIFCLVSLGIFFVYFLYRQVFKCLTSFQTAPLLLPKGFVLVTQGFTAHCSKTMTLTRY